MSPDHRSSERSKYVTRPQAFRDVKICHQVTDYKTGQNMTPGHRQWRSDEPIWTNELLHSLGNKSINTGIKTGLPTKSHPVARPEADKTCPRIQRSQTTEAFDSTTQLSLVHLVG